MRWASIITVVAPLLLVGCTHKVQVEPIQVEPIHVTLDIHVKVDRELEEFFEFEEEYEPDPEPGTQPGATSVDEPDPDSIVPAPPAERSA